MGDKGKHASGTQNRRFAWARVVWPLVLELKGAAFTLEQYQAKRDEVCKSSGATITTVSRGLASLIQKGLVIKEDKLYSIHFRYLGSVALGDMSTSTRW